MANIFGLRYFIFLIVTIILLSKPSLTAQGDKASLPRLKIFVYGLLASLFSMVMIGVFSPKIDPKQLDVDQFTDDKVKVTQHDNVIEITPIEAKSQAEIDQDAEDYKQKVLTRRQALTDEDRPQFKSPPVDYTKAVSKVDIHSDKAIIKAAGKPVVDQEKGTNQNGEPMMNYWFDKQPAYGLELGLSREYIDVSWSFGGADPAKAFAAFEDGQRITRALLGGQDGGALYENIAKGGKVEELNLEDGTVIKNARCGQTMCRYQVVR